jgi:3-hydroxyacyl-[acyl-carrier-protein] dehydratase
MRFQLIDRIQRLEPRKSIAAIKNLSLAEEYLADHFPGFPVLPGVLMIEALTQAGAWLMKASEEFAYSTVMLRQAKAVKFNSFVSPGKALAVSLDVVSWVDGECTLKGTGTVDGLSAVSARLVLKRFNLADANPSMAKAGHRRGQGCLSTDLAACGLIARIHPLRGGCHRT